MSLLKEIKIKTEEENKKQADEIEIKLRRLNRTLSSSASISSSHADCNDLPDSEPPVEQSEDDGPKVKEETKTVGSIDSSVYVEYIKAGAGPFLIFITFSSMIVSQVLFNGSDLWLTTWLVFVSN
jgi:hypothetical protein